MAEETVQIPLPGGESVTGIASKSSTGAGGWLVLYAPGAGSNVHDPFGTFLCRVLADAGISSLRFQFPYKERGNSRPDPPRVLEATWLTVIEHAREPGIRLCVGGRSMGGRIASQVVAQGVAVDALELFAYPLHPPGKPEQRRDAHLPEITAPAFFCSGSRDAFASPAEIAEAAALVPRSTMHLLEHADHGFAAPKASGRTRADVWEEAAGVFSHWLQAMH